MIGRCGDKNNPHYGKKGIQVCAEWRTDYQRFLADMGEVPSPNHSIDRIDSNGHYEPNNCRWATDIEQARNANTNRVMEFQGRRMTMAEASEVYGIAYSALQQRMTAGWSAERALTTPVRVKRHA